jgi:hypothetical protein
MYPHVDPQQEGIRVAAIERYRIFDTPPEETFDRVVSIVSAVFGTPMARLLRVCLDLLAPSAFDTGAGDDDVATRSGNDTVINRRP